jgi:hypothetical protein
MTSKKEFRIERIPSQPKGHPEGTPEGTAKVGVKKRLDCDLD